MKYIDVAKVADLPPGSTLSVEVDEEGRGIALFNVDGKLFALDNTCPHAGGPLGEGTLQGDIIRCPWHGWKFNVRTGQCLKNPVDDWAVSCFPVRIEQETIQIALEHSDPAS